MRATVLLVLGLALTGCSDDGAQPGVAPSGLAACAAATAPGSPVTAALLRDGCVEGGRQVPLTPYVCRGNGNVIVNHARSVSEPLPLELLDGVPAADPPEKAYGRWLAANPNDPSDITDVGGCFIGPPEG
jgi:hypothetical protein